MNKKEDIKNKVIEGAKKYRDNLLSKNIMFIYKDKRANKVYYIETRFYDYNYLHLTGLNYNGSAKTFYNACINNKLSINDFNIKNIGFTDMKLDIMNNILDIHKSAKMIGDFNYKNQQLTIEKVIGTIRCCMGFTLDSRTNYYYSPKTILKEDIKKLTNNTYQIIGIMSKDLKEKLYSEITYIANETSIDILLQNENVKSKIELENLKAENKLYNQKINKFYEELHILKEKNKNAENCEEV